MNRRRQTNITGLETPRKTVLFDENALPSIERATTPEMGSGRKRKVPLTPPDSSPIQITPSKKSKFSHGAVHFDILEDEPDLPRLTQAPIRRARGVHLRVLERSFGEAAISPRRRIDHCTSWISQTADFYSSPEDTHKLTHLPFCSTSCNTNSLVAVADEEGWVTLIDTAPDARSNPHLQFQPHVGNAIMDMTFSSNDLLLATASGDQTAQVVDMRTQSTIFALSKHMSSVKQIRFQPGNDNIIATSGRDGTVQLWDLRCSGAGGTRPLLGGSVTYATTFNSINDAHGEKLAAMNGNISRDIPSKGEVSNRRGDVSITSIHFLPAEHGREHLLLTASDVSTTVKLWDIRARYSRRGAPVAVSATMQPEAHSRHRHFGITSLVLSGDSKRFYTLSRDNTMYAYSTNHLILGQAPELDAPTSRHRHNSAEKPGLGPLYGFRHPQFHATTFYVKAALRKAHDDKPEMIAVGSSDGCPVLFPTDETTFPRSMPNETEEERYHPSSSPFPSSPTLRAIRPQPIRRTSTRSALSTGASTRLQDTIPIYSHGTPLVRGHDREVTSVCWGSGGELVSVGDDFRARIWREETLLRRSDESGELASYSARDLRLAGEGEGKRWGCGWADLGDNEAWDEEEG